MTSAVDFSWMIMYWNVGYEPKIMNLFGRSAGDAPEKSTPCCILRAGQCRIPEMTG